jgi:hypothetical protein
MKQQKINIVLGSGIVTAIDHTIIFHELLMAIICVDPPIGTACIHPTPIQTHGTKGSD